MGRGRRERRDARSVSAPLLPRRPDVLVECTDVCTGVALEREVEGDLFLADIGQGFPFRPGSFDGAIS